MASISHDAETQRQYPRYRLPMEVAVKDRLYKALDWSMGGFALPMGGEFYVGETLDVTLVAPFDGYTLNIKAKAQVRYMSAEGNRIGFAFVEFDDRQASLLRYISDAILSGEVVSAGDVMDVARRTGTGRSRNVPSAASGGAWERIGNVSRRLGATAGVLVIAGALGTYLWANVYDRLYVVRAASASVSAKVVNLASPAVGRIGYLNEKPTIALGEPLMTINPPVGNPITVQSPCDCRQIDQQFANGDFVKTGDTVVRLTRTDAPIVVSAQVPSDRLMSLYGLKSARILYADGNSVEDAGILWLPGQGDDKADLPRDASTVVLEPRRELSPSMMGQPVQVTFDLFPDSTLGRAYSSLSGSIQAVAGVLPGKSNEPVRRSASR